MSIQVSFPIILCTILFQTAFCNTISSFINPLTECHIFILNFQKNNLDKHINRPVLLMNFFSLKYDNLIYPINLQGLNFSQIYSSFIANGKWLPYMRTLDNHNVRTSRRCKCIFTLYLLPPSVEPDIGHLYEFPDNGFLKEPYSQNRHMDASYYENIRRRRIIQTTTQYFVLLSNFTTEIRVDEIYKSWLKTTWLHRSYTPILNNYFLVIQVEIVQDNLRAASFNIKWMFQICLFCDPCNPATLLNITQYRSQLQVLKNWSSNGPHFYLVIPMEDMPYEDYSVRKSRKMLIDQLLKYKRDIDPSIMHGLWDAHFISMVVPDNVNFTTQYENPHDMWQPKQIYLEMCHDKILYPALLRPGISRYQYRYLGQHLDASIVIHRKTLKYISCYYEERNWLQGLSKLVDSFDTEIWITLVISFLSVASVVACGNMLQQKFIRKHIHEVQNTFLSVMLQLIAWLWDQSTDEFEKNYLKNKRFMLGLRFTLPLAIFILGNEFKSYSISDLSVPASPVAFDNFNLLVKHEFLIYSLPVFRENIMPDINNVTKSQRDFHNDVVAHLAYPVTSQFWHRVMLTFNWDWKHVTKNDISSELWYYLNKTSLYPGEPNISKGEYNYFVGGNVLYFLTLPHLTNCNKSAAILDGKKALLLYAALEQLNYNVYLGKEVLHESLQGYQFERAFDQNLLNRAKRIFQSGIGDWWRNYFDMLVQRKGFSDQQLYLFTGKWKKLSSHKSSKDIRNLIAVPVVGCGAAIVLFIISKTGLFLAY